MARDDQPESIPSFTASRDEAVSSAPRGAVPARGTRHQSATPAGMGALARIVLTVALVAAAVACAWAFQLQKTLEQANADARLLGARVADLEALLSDTDESVEKSAAALGAQLKVVDTETRRLEQRRREMDEEIKKLQKANTSQQAVMGQLEPRIAKAEGEIIQVNNGVSGLKTDLATLKKAADDLEQLSKTAKDAQINMERIADNVNKANLDQAALTKRVATNEEWIESINAFRKQVNGNINRLETQLRAMQSTPSPAQSNQ
ncbi:MAG: hypothetical protein RLZZ602_740 [Pseudomonadota bacterium]